MAWDKKETEQHGSLRYTFYCMNSFLADETEEDETIEMEESSTATGGCFYTHMASSTVQCRLNRI